MSEKEYLVRWVMDIEADDARDAAEAALAFQRDPQSIATVFAVTDKKTGKITTVDLTENTETEEEPATDEFRTMLLRLIENAPDPTGFTHSLPGYRPIWEAARMLLATTCPTSHRDNGASTCADCHADLGK